MCDFIKISKKVLLNFNGFTVYNYTCVIVLLFKICVFFFNHTRSNLFVTLIIVIDAYSSHQYCTSLVYESCKLLIEWFRSILHTLWAFYGTILTHELNWIPLLSLPLKTNLLMFMLMSKSVYPRLRVETVEGLGMRPTGVTLVIVVALMHLSCQPRWKLCPLNQAG